MFLQEYYAAKIVSLSGANCKLPPMSSSFAVCAKHVQECRTQEGVRSVGPSPIRAFQLCDAGLTRFKTVALRLALGNCYEKALPKIE